MEIIQKLIKLKQPPKTNWFKMLFVLLVTLCSFPTISATNIGGKRVIGYYIEWGGYSRKFYTDQIKANNWTHINYSFIKPTWDAATQTGGVTFADSYASLEANWNNAFPLWSETPKGHVGLLKKLKANNPGLKLTFSIGGWTMSHAFPEIAASENGRNTFAAACKSLLDTYGFDGIELDWEYPIKGGTDGTEFVNGINIPIQTYKPGSEDAVNLVKLTKAIDAAIGDKELSIAMSPYLYGTYPDQLPRYVLPNNKAAFGCTDDITMYLDYINVMTYDYGGTWNSKTAVNSPLYYSNSTDDENPSFYNVSSALAKVIEAGVPASKLNMGIPFYGRLFDGVVNNSSNGLYVPWDRTREKGTWDVGVQPNENSAVLSYGDLIDDAGTNATSRISHTFLSTSDYKQGIDGYTRYWNSNTRTPYLYNSSTGTFIDYDDPQSISEKIRYGLNLGIGGFMAWEISQDGRTSNILSNTIVQTIQAKKVKVNVDFKNIANVGVNGIQVIIRKLDGTIEKDSTLTNNSSASFLLTNGLDYTVSFAKANSAFLPSTASLKSLVNESSLNILVGDTPYSASGTCKEANNTPISGITMGAYYNQNLIDSKITDQTGTFKFDNLISGIDIMIKPIDATSYTYAPASYIYNISAPRTDLNFVCSRNVAAINITLNKAIPGVIITAKNTTTNALVTTSTDSQGKAIISNLTTGYDYIVSASKPNIVFLSPSQTITLNTSTYDVSFALDPSIVISGVVMFDNVAQANKTINVTGSWISNDLPWFSKTAITDANGKYIITGIKTGYPSLVVSLNSWEFNGITIPANIKTSQLIDNNPNGYYEINFSNTAIGKSVSGLVVLNNVGVSGATVRLLDSSNIALQTVTTDTNGGYTFDNVPDGNYTVDVTKGLAYTFSPTSQSVTVGGSNINIPTFDTTIDSRTYTLTSNIIDASNNIAVTPITEMSLSGPDVNMKQSTTSGIAILTLPIFSNFIVTPSANGYRFEPVNASIVSITKNETVNFKAIPKAHYTINATVTNSTTNAALPNVTVTLKLDGQLDRIGTTDSNGKISFSNIEEGSIGTLAYSLTGYVFTTSLVTINGLSNNLDLTTSGRKSSFTPLPNCAVIGYWHGWLGSGDLKYTLKLSEVDPSYNVLIVSFAETPSIGSSGYGFEPVLNVDYNRIYGSKQAFIDDIKAVKAKGIPVLFSIGGQNGHIELKSTEERDVFVEGLKSIINEYGFDGFDIDFEGGSMSFFSDLSAPLTSWNYATLPAGKLKNTIDAVRTLCDYYGDDFILTAAPETYYVQVGYSAYTGTGLVGSFLPVIDNLRDKLDVLQVQLYNTGSVSGTDGKTYTQATPDFIVAMTDMLLKGFKAGTNGPNFAPLRQDQVAIGIPATSSAAPAGGYLAPAEGTKALNYLKNRISYNGGYSLTSSYPNLRGVMTWSVNWDQSLNGRGGDESKRYEFGKTYASLCGNTGLEFENGVDNENISITPNPNNGAFNIEVKNSAYILAIYIYDVAGNVMYTEEFDNSKAVSSKRLEGLSLSPNTYCVVVKTSKGFASSKMITIK